MKQRLVDAFMKDREFAATAIRSVGTVRITFVIRTHDGELEIFSPVGVKRDEAYKMLRLFAVALDAEAVTVMSEAWALFNDQRPGDSPEDHLVVLPRDSERRIEVVTVMLATADEGRMSVREIKRDATGKITGLGPERGPRHTVSIKDMGGEIAHVVPRERPSVADRATARLFLEAMKAPRADA